MKATQVAKLSDTTENNDGPVLLSRWLTVREYGLHPHADDTRADEY